MCVRALCAMCIIIRRKNHKKMDCILYKRKEKEKKEKLFSLFRRDRFIHYSFNSGINNSPAPAERGAGLFLFHTRTNLICYRRARTSIALSKKTAKPSSRISICPFLSSSSFSFFLFQVLPRAGVKEPHCVCVFPPSDPAHTQLRDSTRLDIFLYS